ncbi:hypothetical protein ACM66B_002877 [Microbotryomycetes sp. NB124-2]
MADRRSLSLPGSQSVEASSSQQSRDEKTLNNGSSHDQDESTATDSRKRRSVSAPSQLPTAARPLQQYEFVMAADSSSQIRWPRKHEGTGALKRVFVGPHFVGQGSSNEHSAGKHKPLGLSATALSAGATNISQLTSTVQDDSSTDSESSTSSNSGSGNGEARRRREQRSRLPTGETVHANSRKSSDHKWVGNSFEIGGDVREAMARRQRRRRRSSASTAEHTATTTAKEGADTFVTARTHQPAVATRYELKQPPPDVESQLPPDLAHALLRRPSDPPINETASLSAAPVGSELAPTADFGSALASTRSRHAIPNGLGNGFPPVPTGDTSASVKSVPTPRPIIGRARTSEAASRKATVKFSNHLDKASLVGDLSPAPAEEVLARPVPDTMVPDDVEMPPLRPPRRRDDILATERMLCRVDWTVREDLPDLFDEHNARKFPTRHEGFEEFGVVLRRNRVELWTEYKNPVLSLIAGKKKLKHVIPLKKTQTKLSLYSSVDNIFCLTHCPAATNVVSAASSVTAATTAKIDRDTDEDEGDSSPWWRKSRTRASKRAYVHFRHSGTSIYILKAKTMSIAKDWIWQLFVKLGGQVPRTLEVSVPVLNAKLKAPIPRDLPLRVDGRYLWPEEREAQGWKLLKPSSVVRVCMERLAVIPDFREVCEQYLQGGTAPVALAWRRGRFLDWVKTGKDEDDWATICGIALRQTSVDPVLELRLALHAPTTVRLPAKRNEPNIRLSEPPAVEGFLMRFRKSQVNERIYVSSHDGFLFICRPSAAQPPEPPAPLVQATENPAVLVLAPFVAGFASLGKEPRKRDKIVERIGISRIGGGRGIKEKRKRDRALSMIDKQSSSEQGGDDDMMAVFDQAEKSRLFKQICDARGYIDLRDVVSIEPDLNEEEEAVARSTPDIGGAPGVSIASDKTLLVRQRSFLIKRKDGHAMRFECHSIAVREEWVGRLRALVTFWSQRQIATARDHMELIGPHLRPTHPTSTHTDPRNHDNDADPDPMLLTQVYNFCIQDGCRPIMLSGRFFVKVGLRGMFKERCLVLLPGTLIEYQVFARDMFGQPISGVYHRRKRVTSLRGCFVYSGRLTAHLLSPHNISTWDPADSQEKFPRIYPQDKLKVTDDEEDCTLVLFKRRNGGGGRFGKGGKTYVLRARSMIERNQWVFALNAAIEQLGDAEYERETRLKDFGWLKA